jgi:hypothetical protein
MPIEPISNFIAGIKAASGYTPLKNVSASEIINYDIDDFGRLVKRRGYERMNSVALPATPKSMIRAYYRTTGLTSREHLIVACNNATGVWYWNGAAFVELKSSSHDPLTSIDLTGGRDARMGYAVYGGRLFMGNGSANFLLGSYQFWVKISGAVPLAYMHGLDKPSAPSGAVVVGGTLEASKYYGYAYTYENNTDSIESEESNRTVEVTTGANKTVNLSAITVGADKQVTQRKIYRTAAQVTEAAAGVAQLYYLDTIADNTTTTYTDNGGTALSTTILPSDDWAAPSFWHYILGDAGMLWIADDDDSQLGFSTFDATGAPVLDGFPGTNILRANPDDGDIITGMSRSSGINQRFIFKRNSVYVLYGNTVSQMQIATRPAMGCVSPWSIAIVSVGGADQTFYLGTDKQVWSASLGGIRPVSLDVNPILADIPESRFGQVMGCEYLNKYLLAFPNGDVENNRVLVYDANKQNWTTYDLATNWLSWWQGEESTDADKNRLIMAESGAAYVDYVFTDASGDDITDDNGNDITASYKTNTFYMPEESIVIGVHIYDVTGSTYSVRVDSVSEGGVATGTTHTGFEPSARNNYRQGVFERGRAFQVFFSTVSETSVVERIAIEWRKT